MKKIFIFVFIFIVLPTYGDDVFTNDIIDGCGVDTLGITENVFVVAEFQPIQITCSSGQYLPANSVNCTACPNEATCSGGTYYFSESRYQGIVYNDTFQENKQPGCISNLLGIGTLEGTVTAVAEYEPNTININWYSVGDTVYETNTCTYGEQIALPATNPTRTGYIFSGWRLRTNN